MIFDLTEIDLHRFKLDLHMELLREWNEETQFIFKPAIMIVMESCLFIIQTDNHEGLIIATYSSQKELLALRIYTNKSPYGDEYFRTKP